MRGREREREREREGGRERESRCCRRARKMVKVSPASKASKTVVKWAQ